MPTKTISVTQNDIKLGVRTDPRACPIANAMIRAGFKKPDIGRLFIRWGNSPDKLWFPTTKKIRWFIDYFDAGEPVHPFTFQLRWKK